MENVEVANHPDYINVGGLKSYHKHSADFHHGSILIDKTNSCQLAYFSLYNKIPNTNGVILDFWSLLYHAKI